MAPSRPVIVQVRLLLRGQDVVQFPRTLPAVTKMIKISRVDFLDVSPPERLIGLGKPHIARLANITAGLAVPVAVVSHQRLCPPPTDPTTTGVPRQRPGLVPAVYSKAHFAARPRMGLLRRRPGCWHLRQDRDPGHPTHPVPGIRFTSPPSMGRQ